MPKKTKPKKKASFGQFDGGRGTRAAKAKTKVSSDARTITGAKLSRKQREQIARQNRGKG